MLLRYYLSSNSKHVQIITLILTKKRVEGKFNINWVLSKADNGIVLATIDIWRKKGVLFYRGRVAIACSIIFCSLESLMLKLSERWSEFFPLCWRFLSSLKCKVQILSSYEYSTEVQFLFRDNFIEVYMLLSYSLIGLQRLHVCGTVGNPVANSHPCMLLGRNNSWPCKNS